MFPLALLGLPKAVLGGIQTFQALKGLDSLSKQPEPNYTVSPELRGAYNRAQSMTNRGFTPTEEAGFRNNLASETAAAQYGAQQQMGGNLAGNIFAGIKARNLNALNRYATDDAAMQRQNIRYADSIGQSIQQQENMATGTDINRRFQKEQAYGGALKAGTENLIGGINYGAAMIAPEINRLGMGLNGQMDFNSNTPQPSQVSTEDLDGLTQDQASQIFNTLPPDQQEYLRKKFESQTQNIG